MVKISIIIPMYNVAQYLERCITSVYNQGLQEAEFEVILINDGSPDTSLEMATILTKGKTNVKIISQENKGLGGARNTGIHNANGDYLVFLDADDSYLNNTLIQLLQKTTLETFDIIEFGAQGVNVDQNVIYTKSVSSDGVLNGMEYYKQYHYMDSACNKLYNRMFLNENNLLFVEHIFIEDYEFNTRAFYKAEKVIGIDLIVAQFLQSPNSITRNVNKTKRLKMNEDIIIVINKINSMYLQETAIKKPFNSDYFEQRLGFLVTTLFYQLFKNRSSYNEFLKLKTRLINENIFFVNYPILDKKKNFFRKVFLKHFFLFKMVSFLKISI